jgi:transposase InsO family protein
MDGVKVSIEALDEDNYVAWAIKTQMLLTIKDQWKGVQDPVANPVESQKALAWMIIHAKDHHSQTLLEKGNAKATWEYLETGLQEQEQCAEAAAVAEAHQHQDAAERESAHQFVARARNLYHDLKAAEGSISEEDLAMRVLTGLPKEKFGTLRTFLLAGGALSLEEMLPKLVLEEQSMGFKLADSDGEEASKSAVAFAARGKGPVSRGKTGESFHKEQGAERSGKKVQCYKCLKMGHMAADCRGKVVCKNCHKAGHMAKDCRKPDKSEQTGIKEKGVAFAAGSVSVKSEEWVLDSGCTQHLTGKRGLFKTFELLDKGARVMHFGNEQSLEAQGIGTVELEFKLPSGKIIDNELTNVLYIPGAAASLFSVKRATAQGAKVVIKDDRSTVHVGKRVVMQAWKSGDLWVLDTVEGDLSFLTKEPADAKLWHRRLGHAGYENLAKMLEGGLVEGVKVTAEPFRAEKSTTCEPCIMGKQTRQPFPASESKTIEPLELVHMDLCGPFKDPSLEGHRYVATILDDYSKLSVVIPLKKKKDVAQVVQENLTLLELQSDKKVKTVRTDRGGEYCNSVLKGYYAEKGNVHQTTVGYAPEQNGAAEQLNRRLLERARAQLADADLGPKLWAEVMLTANYTKNRTPASAHDKTPTEAFFGTKPDVSHMRVFGAQAYVHVPKEKRHKLAPVSEQGVFVGYPGGVKGYKVLRKRDGKVILARDVIFDERPPKAREGNLQSAGAFKSEYETPTGEVEIELEGPEGTRRCSRC